MSTIRRVNYMAEYFGNIFYDYPVLAHAAHLPGDPPFVCQWIGESGACNLEFSLDHLRNHFQEYHDIQGSDDSRVRCLWNGCNKGMKKESFKRHMRSQHLEIAYNCTTCPRSFTRPYNLHHHQRNCPGLQMSK